MITIDILKIRISVTFGFLFLMAVNTMDAQDITLMYLGFSLVHEVSHLAAMKVFGVDVSELSFYGGGIRIDCDDIGYLSRSKKLIIYSAGCIANVVMAAYFAFSGHAQACALNLCIAVFNALPVEYFDGGKILSLAFPTHYRMLKVLSYMCIILIFGCAIAVACICNIAFSPSAVFTFVFIAASELLDRADK